MAFVLASYLVPGIVSLSFPQKEVRTKPGSVQWRGVVDRSHMIEQGNMRRLKTIISAIALVMGLGLPAMTATAVSAQSVPAPTVTGEADWAFGGYSVHPNAGSGWVVDALGSCTVPKVNCPNVAGDAPRTAVWVGMWGTLASMGAGQGWLPQVGRHRVVLRQRQRDIGIHLATGLPDPG